MMAPESDKISREELVALLKEDLAREWQTIIAYVVYSKVIKGAQYIVQEQDHQIALATALGIDTPTDSPQSTAEA